jgi:hypothetical protein
MGPAVSTARVDKRWAAGMFGVPPGEAPCTNPPISRPGPLDNRNVAAATFGHTR